MVLIIPSIRSLLGDSLVFTDGKVLGYDEGIKLGSTHGKLLATIFADVDEITLGIDVGPELGHLGGSFDTSNDGNHQGLLLGVSLVPTGGKVIVSDQGIKLRSTDCKLLVTILVNVDGTTLGLDVGTEMGSLDGSFNDSNDDNIGSLLIGESLGYNEGMVLGSNEGTKLGYTDGKVLDTILGNVDKITLGLDFGTELSYLDNIFDASNNRNFEGLLLGDSLVYDDGKVLGCDEGMNWDLLMVSCLALHLKIYMESHL